MKTLRYIVLLLILPLVVSGQDLNLSFTVSSKETLYGISDRSILRYDSLTKKWSHFIRASFKIVYAGAFENQLVITDYHIDNHFVVNEKSKTLEKFVIPQQLFSSINNKIVQFEIEIGSQGCFHHQETKRVYTRKGEDFVYDSGQSKGRQEVFGRKSSRVKPYLSKMPTKISTKVIHQLVTPLGQKLTYADLKLSPKNIKAFKQLVTQEEKFRAKKGVPFDNGRKNYAFPASTNLNFNDYRILTDSLPRLSDEVVHWVFSQSFGNASTTINWRKVTFTFQDKTKLVVENTDDRPNYLYMPWVVTYKGLVLKSTSIKFGELLNELTKGEFFEPYIQDKKYAILNMTNLLYVFYADQKKRKKKK